MSCSRARVADGRLLALAVAARAELRDVARERRRGRVLLALDAVRAVALAARRGVRVALGVQLAVDALAVLLHRLGVARGAVHLLGDRGARALERGPHLGVALAARRVLAWRDCASSAASTYSERPSAAGLDLRPARGRRGSPGPPSLARRRPCGPCAAGGSRGTPAGRWAAFSQSSPLDDLAVDLLDRAVALRAGRGDVLARDRGARVGVRQHEVRGVAGDARRRSP